MKKSSASRSAFFTFRVLLAVALLASAVVLAIFASSRFTLAQAQSSPSGQTGIQSVHSYQNDISPALRDLPTLWPPKDRKGGDEREMREVNLNPKLPLPLHVDRPDPVVQDRGVSALALLAPSIPASILNFDGIPFPGVGCSCAPPDTNGAVGTTQYVQMVNKGYQVFNKTTGASVLGPLAISTIWTGFGGVCETNGDGDPVVLYDHLANRWLISQFAGTSVPTDECVAISQTSDATGAYFRYAFHLGTNFFDYPHLGVWPDGYYMAMNVFNSAGTAFLGPQAFAFDRAKMLAGMPATFVTPGITGGGSEPSFLPSDIDGSILPAAGTANPFVSFPGTGTYKVRLFHADYATPGNTTFTLIGSPPAGGFTELCPTTRACVPQIGSSNNLDGIGDRLMFRLAYRKFVDGHEGVVGNYSVSAGGVAGVRWFEIRGVTTAPVVYQESTYQPDSTWRWMGSVAQDQSGNMAIGFSASSPTINPQIRYAGRLVNDPLNTLSQGEAHLFDGIGSQTGTGDRWGDYSSLTVDPVDDCTFWYTQEYMATTSSFNWRTRIGSFKFAQCSSVPTPVIVPSASSITSEGCTPPNGVIDPNETVTVSFCVQNGGSGPTTSNLTGTLLNTGGVTGASGPKNYGAINPGNTSCKPFTFTAAGSCGGTLTATIHFQDGATDLGNVTYTFQLGVLQTVTSFSENFDGVTAPALPAGWSATNASGAALWMTSTTTPDTAPNDAFVDDPPTVSDKRLDTPGIAITSAGSQLSFRNNYALESGFDGGVLEVSSPNINAGAFTDVTNAAVGGSFVAGGYNSTISTIFGNLLAGRQAWSGSSGGYINTVVNPGPNVVGQTIQLRFRMASDTSVAITGWRVDSVTLSTSSFVCCNSTPTADLKVTITDGKTTVARGDQSTYTIVVKNRGPDTATGAGVSDVFPLKFKGVTYTASATGGASGFTPMGSGNISDSVTMPAGSTITYLATGTVSTTAQTKIVDKVSVSIPSGTSDPLPGNNTARDVDTISP